MKYISGKRAIKPATQAACDSLQLMGNRKFYDQMTADLCQHEKDKITDEVDITTIKDYMKVCNHNDMVFHPRTSNCLLIDIKTYH